MNWKNELYSLTRLQHAKQSVAKAEVTLGSEMVGFFKQTIQQRQTKLSKIAQVWVRLVPESLNDHCALHGLSRGTLTVLVDSSPHLFDLKQLLLAGLQDQILMQCQTSGLRKISLRPGQPDDLGRRGR